MVDSEKSLRILLVSDAWHPQINGIVTTLTYTRRELERLGHRVELVSPDRFRNYPCPGYPDVRLSFLCGPSLWPIIEAFRPDAIHLATEGPVGFAARRYCLRKGYAWTTSFHSHYHEYLRLRIGFPEWLSYGYLKWFHHFSHSVMVSTDSLEQALSSRGFGRFSRWSRGVDIERFRPRDKSFLDAPRPIAMFAGRVAIEKNLEAFLKLDLPGSKFVVGDGPLRSELAANYPNARFVGYQQGESLAQYLAAADVFVFPSRTDTFGLVMLEALASGVPVAAFPVPGPNDLIKDAGVGVLDHDLRSAVIKALSLDPKDCRRYAERFSWHESTRQFLGNLTPIRALS